MAILKVQKHQNPYVMLDKGFLNNPKLSAKAKGLLAYLLTLPADWQIHVDEITRHFSDGKKSVYSGIKELTKYHYIIREHTRNDDGSFKDCQYTVFEIAQPESSCESRHLPPYSQKGNTVNSLKTVANGNEISPYAEKGDAGDTPYSLLGDAGKRRADNRPLIINNNNKEIKKTAADTDNSNNHIITNKKSAAVFSFSPVIAISGLSAEQEAHVHKFTQKTPKDTLYTPEQLTNSIITTLEDANQFTEAGMDFQKKLNTVMKCFRLGTWHPLIESEKQKASQGAEKLTLLERKIHELRNERSGLVGVIQRFSGLQSDSQEPLIVASCKDMVAIHRKKLSCLENQLKDLNKQLQVIKKNIAGIEESRTPGKGEITDVQNES